MAQKSKTLLARWVQPAGAVVLLVCAAAAFLLAAVFVRRLNQTPLAYGVYAFSTYALVVFVVWLTKTLRRLQAWGSTVPLLCRWREDRTFHARGKALLGLGISLGYSVFKAAAGIWFRSAWFGASAFYYLTLSGLRLWLLHQLFRGGVTPAAQYRGCRVCGWLLLAVTLPVAVLGVHMVAFDRAAQYPGFIIYAAAAYTFYTMGSAVANLVRLRQEKKPLLAAMGITELVKALVAMFSLQSALLAAFSPGAASNRLANALTGGAVCAAVVALAVWLIVVSGRRLHQQSKT